MLGSNEHDATFKTFDALPEKRLRLDKDGHRKASSAAKSKSATGIAVVCKPDGRVCRLCAAKDTDTDIVITTRTWKWGYPHSLMAEIQA